MDDKLRLLADFGKPTQSVSRYSKIRLPRRVFYSR
jgi:hypothetical protein